MKNVVSSSKHVTFKNLIFDEVQTIKKWYIWLIMAFLQFLSILWLIKSFVDYANNSPGAASYIILACLANFIVLFFMISAAGSKLKTKITDNAIYFQWTPLSKRFNKVHWQNVRKIGLIPYKKFAYGMRISDDYGLVYNSLSGIGIFIETKGDNKYLISTTEPDKMEKVIHRVQVLHDFEYYREI